MAGVDTDGEILKMRYCFVSYARLRWVGNFEYLKFSRNLCACSPVHDIASSRKVWFVHGLSI